MKTITNLLLFTLVWFAFTSCHKKCVDDQVAALKLTQEDLNINPYSGSEILIFKALNNDSIVFPKGVRKTEVQIITEINSGDAMEYHDGCTGNFLTKEYNWMEKNTNKSNCRLDINLYFPQYTIYNPTTERELKLFFWFDSTNVYCFNGRFRFKSDTIYKLPYPGDSIISYYKSLSIGPKNFNNVYALYCLNPDPRLNTWISTSFYSIKEGLVGFKSNFGKLWYLDKIRK